MIGGICGDVIGSRLEFGHNIISEDFKLLTENNTFTDDTVFLVSMMDCIINHSTNYQAYLIKWCKKYKDVGYGANFEYWLKSDVKESYKSKGNGCLIRVIPIAYHWSSSIEELDKEVERVVGFTHNSEDSYEWSKAIARTIYLTKRGYPAGKILKNVETVLDNIKFSNIVDIKGIRSELAKDIAPYAIITGLTAKSYEDGVRDIIYRNIDNDTGAAIVGAILEAREFMPKDNIKNRIMEILPNDMKNIIEKFYKK